MQCSGKSTICITTRSSTLRPTLPRGFPLTDLATLLVTLERSTLVFLYSEPTGGNGKPWRISKLLTYSQLASPASPPPAPRLSFPLPPTTSLFSRVLGFAFQGSLFLPDTIPTNPRLHFSPSDAELGIQLIIKAPVQHASSPGFYF